MALLPLKPLATTSLIVGAVLSLAFVVLEELDVDVCVVDVEEPLDDAGGLLVVDEAGALRL